MLDATFELFIIRFMLFRLINKNVFTHEISGLQCGCLKGLFDILGKNAHLLSWQELDHKLDTTRIYMINMQLEPATGYLSLA